VTTATGRPAPGKAPREPGQAAAAVLEELYRAFFVRLVRRACWRYGLSKEDAREVVHDAFLLALVKLNADGNPRAWIYGVVDRLAANWRRKEVRRSRLRERWGGGRPTESDTESVGLEDGCLESDLGVAD
jgi:DNA-directed RNA polymerase specialized sigma24 family protein